MKRPEGALTCEDCNHWNYKNGMGYCSLERKPCLGQWPICRWYKPRLLSPQRGFTAFPNFYHTPSFSKLVNLLRDAYLTDKLSEAEINEILIDLGVGDLQRDTYFNWWDHLREQASESEPELEPEPEDDGQAAPPQILQICFSDSARLDRECVFAERIVLAGNRLIDGRGEDIAWLHKAQQLWYTWELEESPWTHIEITIADDPATEIEKLQQGDDGPDSETAKLVEDIFGPPSRDVPEDESPF